MPPLASGARAPQIQNMERVPECMQSGLVKGLAPRRARVDRPRDAPSRAPISNAGPMAVARAASQAYENFDRNQPAGLSEFLHRGRRLSWAVKPISWSRRNDGYCAASGPSRGCSRKGASAHLRPSHSAVRYQSHPRSRAGWELRQQAYRNALARRRELMDAWARYCEAERARKSWRSSGRRGGSIAPRSALDPF